MRGIGVGASAADRGWGWMVVPAFMLALSCSLAAVKGCYFPATPQQVRVSQGQHWPFRYGDRVCVKHPGGQRIELVGSGDNTARVEYCTPDGQVCVTWRLSEQSRAVTHWPVSAVCLVEED